VGETAPSFEEFYETTLRRLFTALCLVFTETGTPLPRRILPGGPPDCRLLGPGPQDFPKAR
jgi:hypothetical protein